MLTGRLTEGREKTIVWQAMIPRVLSLVLFLAIGLLPLRAQMSSPVSAPAMEKMTPAECAECCRNNPGCTNCPMAPDSDGRCATTPGVVLFFAPAAAWVYPKMLVSYTPTVAEFFTRGERPPLPPPKVS